MSIDKTAHSVQAIRAVYPHLQIRAADYREGGQYNDILIVNGDLVFRFPRYPEAVETLARETALLTALDGRLPLPVPKPIYLNIEAAAVGSAFMGYCILPGEPVNIYQLESRYDDGVCQQLADQLARFLKALHSLKIDNAPSGITLTFWHDLYQRIREKLYPLLSPAVQSDITHHFESYLTDPRSSDYPRCLCHNDFGIGNILFDPEDRRFTGVIDFAFAGVSDPAVDLAAIYGFQGRGDVFARRLFRLYPELEAMLPRAQFYAGTYLLQEALFGIENNEPDLIESGLEPYR